MEILDTPINKLRPDPDQPRKSFNPDRLSELAQSIKTTGIINAIEVDKNFVIVTGEYRWRAAKEAGLKTVPCKVVDLTKEERFLRQIVENVQHTEMTPWDTGLALKRVLAKLPGNFARDKFHNGDHFQRGVKELSKIVGKSPAFVQEHLYLIEKASEPIKRAVKKGLPISQVRTITRAPEKYQKAMEMKVLKGEFKTRDGGLHVVEALKREQGNPDKVQKLLSIDYSKFKTSQDVGQVVRKISPNLADHINQSFEPVEQLSLITDELTKWLEDYSPKSLGKLHIGVALVNLAATRDAVDKWLKKKN